MIFQRAGLRLRSYLKSSLQDSSRAPTPQRGRKGQNFSGSKGGDTLPPSHSRCGRWSPKADARVRPAGRSIGLEIVTLTLEGHPGNLLGTPPRRTRGRAGLKGTCPSVRTSERWAGRGGEDAGGGRGPCTHPAPVPPDLNLHGTHHFPGPPSHPENRVGPRGLPNSGQPGPPRPSARTAFHPGALGCAALPPAQRVAGAVSARQAPAQGWVFRVTNAPHASQEACAQEY